MIGYRSKLLGGQWAIWWRKRDHILQIAINEGGNEFSFNLQLLYGIIPIGYYAAVRIWNSYWLRSSRLR